MLLKQPFAIGLSVWALQYPECTHNVHTNMVWVSAMHSQFLSILQQCCAANYVCLTGNKQASALAPMHLY